MKTNEDYSKAVEFVKKYGWESANLAVKRLLPMTDVVPVFDYGSEDLKRLVESWELVEKVGGLNKAKADLASTDYNSEQDFYENLKQAIADVESCNE